MSEQQNQNLVETYQDGKVVFDGKIIRLEHWTVKLPNGNLALREVACHPGASAVVALDEDNNVILVHQYRAPMHRVTLEIPAGKLAPGEDPADCAVRELEEETGLKAERMTLLTSVLTTPGFCTEKIGIYLAQGLSQGETHPDEDEFLGVVRMPLEEAINLVMRGEIRDGKTICGLLMAREVIRSQKEKA